MAGLVVEGAAAGDQGDRGVLGLADDLADRRVGRIVESHGVDEVDVGLVVVAGDLDLGVLLERGDVVEDGRTDVPVVDVAGEDDVALFTRAGGLLVPGDNPGASRVLHHAVDDLDGLDLGIDADRVDGQGDGAGAAEDDGRRVEADRPRAETAGGRHLAALGGLDLRSGRRRGGDRADGGEGGQAETGPGERAA